jgi:predicted  nucleic acid-binding Zn-ribbon protein
MPKFDRGGEESSDNGNNSVARITTLEISEPRCSVCKSPRRRAIDRLLVYGVPYSELSRTFADENISRRSFATHKERHMSTTDKAVREIIEEQIRQQGEDVMEQKKLILTRQAALDAAVMQGFNGIMDGVIPIEARDWVQMINLREKLEEKTASIQLEETMTEFSAFMQAVKEVVPEDMWVAVAEKTQYILNLNKTVIDSYGVEVVPDRDVQLPAIEPPPDIKFDD